MKRWLDTKWWTALAATVLLGIASIFISVPPRKRLVIYKTVQTPIFLQSFPGTQISVNGRVLPGVYAETFGVCNCGSVPITPSDFEDSITLTFGSNELVVPSFVGTSKPDRPLLPVSATGSILEIKPVLLNPGDSMCISVLTTFSGDPQLHAHVAGIERVEYQNSTNQTTRSSTNSIFSIWPIGLGLTVLAAILLCAVIRLFSKSRFVFRRRFAELLLACVATAGGGLLLLDYGALSLGLYERFPSKVSQVTFFAALWSSAGWLFARGRRISESRSASTTSGPAHGKNVMRSIAAG